jgi:hypothetical protein
MRPARMMRIGSAVLVALLSVAAGIRAQSDPAADDVAPARSQTRVPFAPPGLTELAARAGLGGGRVAAWCRAEFRSGQPGAFALAVASAAGGGRYVALDANGAVTDLGPFEGMPDLSCYTRAQALALDVLIGRSKTIEGRVAPRWDATVVCGFTDDTSAMCWQYSPDERAFVVVGRWTT